MTEIVKIDRRIERTRRVLWTALLNLLQNTNWETINVQSICNEADVARSTFYLHFQNKQELLEHGFEIGLAEARKEAQTLKTNGSLGSITWLVEHVSQNKKFFKATRLAHNPISIRFEASVRNLLLEELEQHSIECTDTELIFIVGGVFSILENWILTDKMQPSSKIIESVQSIAKNILRIASKSKA